MFKKIIGGTCGVYALARGRTIVYVGQSKNMFQRIGQHINEGKKEFDAYEMYSIGHQEFLDELEAKLIEIYNPEYNKKLKSKNDDNREMKLIDYFHKRADKEYEKIRKRRIKWG